MPTPPSNPLRVAECGDCGQLFAVYETSGEVVCPSCSARVALGGLEVAELQVAPAAPIEVPAPAPTPEPKAEAAPPAPPTAPEPEPERSPTVAEWLMQSESPAAPATPAPPAEEPTPAPSLAESLGWQPGSFEVETPQATTPPARETGTTPAEPIPAETPVAPAEEFRFDFGATPLSEQPAATGETATGGFDASVEDDSQPQAADYDWTQASEPKRRRWFGPMTAAAGLLAVVGPAAFFVMNSEDPSVAAAGEGRALRETITQPDEASYASDFETPPLPYEPSELPAASEEEASPIVDPATQPASFNQPTPSFETTEPGSETPSVEAAAGAATPPVDPFNAPLPKPTPTAEPTPVDRYDASQEDRYASLPEVAESIAPPAEAPVEQATFTPPPAEAPPTIPVETAPYEAPVPRVGLVNAPTYSIDDLNAAIATARPAGEGFASGTLTDPQQVQTMGQHYARLCHLAQLLTLFESDPTDSARLTAELEATDVFRRLFREGRPRVESSQIAGPWIGWTARPHGGVFFTGIPEDVSQQGEVVQYLFRTGETTTAVLVEERLDVDRYITAGAREIGVLGVIVENPREWIAGYEGDAQRIVWARKTLPLPAAPQQP
ncbi:hypothetical protein MalM25_05090 [Planctomycetes bacterium MalM25]|nr:hypothetical protein MalM25_05090 [Planctomycetes bacterium MalM25]